LSQASVAHDVQTITMALQPAARRLTQRITFTAIDCPTGNNCMGDAFYGSTPPATIGAPVRAMLCRSWCGYWWCWKSTSSSFRTDMFVGFIKSPYGRGGELMIIICVAILILKSFPTFRNCLFLFFFTCGSNSLFSY
jgi:hypothetical protein